MRSGNELAEDDFFAGAAIVGNSLVEGLRMYSDLPLAYYGGNSRSVFDNRLNELLQHEYDHLDGILATMRAVDNKSFFLMEMTRDL